MAQNYFDKYDQAPAEPALPPVPVVPALPKRDADIRNSTASADASTSNAQVNVQQENRMAARQAAELPKIAAEVKETELDTERKAREAEQALRAKFLKEHSIDEKTGIVLEAIKRARGKLSGYSTGYGSLLKNLPASDARSLRNEIDLIKANNMLSAMQALKDASPTGATGLGSQTEAEGRALQDAIGALDQGAETADVEGQLQRLETHYTRMNNLLHGRPADPTPNAPVEMVAPEMKLLDGGQKAQEVSKEAQLLHGQLLSQIPRGKLTIEAYRAIRDQVDQSIGGVGASAFDPKGVEEFVKAYNNPKVRININIPGMEVAPNEWERNVTAAGATSTGAALGNFVNASTAGLPSLIGGEGTRKGLDLVNANSPNASLFGEIAGSLVGTKGMGAAGKLARLDRLGAGEVVRDLSTDMAYSGVRGFNEADKGEGVDTAIANALLAGGVNLGARGALRGLRDLGDPATRKAAEGYADLTPFQQIGAPEIENAIKDLPLVHSAKEASVKAFSRKYKDEGLGIIGKKLSDNTVEGRGTIDEMQREIQTGYNEFKGRVGGKLTSTGRTKIKELLNPANYDPAQQKLVERLNKIVGNLGKPGQVEFTGEELLQANSQLTKLANDLGKSDPKFNPEKAGLDQEMGRKVAELRELLVGRLPKRGDQVRLHDLNRAYSKELQINSAASGATAEGIVTPEAALAAVKKFDPSQGKADFAAGNARFQPEAEEAARVLGASPSGDVNARGSAIARLLIPGAMLGGGLGLSTGDDAVQDGSVGTAAGGATLAALAAALYAKPTRRIMQPLVAGKRPLGLDKLDPSLVSQAIQALYRGDQ